MFAYLSAITKITELRQRLLFLLAAVIVFRIGTFIPVPGIDPTAMAALFDQQRGTILDMFNMFAGGALERLSLFALGVMPYISASIIIQLLAAVVPTLAALKKEGTPGRRKLTHYTRYLTLLLATFQSIGVGIALQSQVAGGSPVVPAPGPTFVFTAAVSLVTGTMFLLWLGEQITERGIGNGISMIIFAGIVAGLPGAIGGTLELARTGALSLLRVLFLLALALTVIALVVFVERGQRRVSVNYAQRHPSRGRYPTQTNHLPLKLNMSGVIPVIFASSLILFPATLSTWFGNIDRIPWLQTISTMLSPGQPLYLTLYASLIGFFCFFYTALIFDVNDTAEQLKRAGAFIPGIRPGKQTAVMIDQILTRLTLVGALYLVAVALLPEFLILHWNVPFYFGGTSLLIIVVVAMDFMAQMQNHLLSHQYQRLSGVGGFSWRASLR